MTITLPLKRIMGLDSIELLMEIENYFGISIPDAEAEKIYTVQIMVDSVALHLNISNENMELRDIIFERLSESLRTLGWTTQQPNLNELISNYLPNDNKRVWTELRKSLKLSIPAIELPRKVNNKIGDAFRKLINWAPAYEWNEITVEQFVTAICANNYIELIDRQSIRSKYEIYVAVIGLTVDKTGVDYYEVTPEKSFTTDLGID